MTPMSNGASSELISTVMIERRSRDQSFSSLRHTTSAWVIGEAS